MSTQVFKMFRPLPVTYAPELRRQVWGRLFGLSIQAARTEAGMSIEEAAGLSGMQLSEWMAIEDGHVPQEMDRLRAIAAAIEMSFDKLMNMVLLCREAWEL
jgi:transcriptional regulator with XRE-family HTH domain